MGQISSGCQGARRGKGAFSVELDGVPCRKTANPSSMQNVCFVCHVVMPRSGSGSIARYRVRKSNILHDNTPLSSNAETVCPQKLSICFPQIFLQSAQSFRQNRFKVGAVCCGQRGTYGAAKPLKS
jgi:hypothetical protein